MRNQGSQRTTYTPIEILGRTYPQFRGIFTSMDKRLEPEQSLEAALEYIATQGNLDPSKPLNGVLDDMLQILHDPVADDDTFTRLIRKTDESLKTASRDMRLLKKVPLACVMLACNVVTATHTIVELDRSQGYTEPSTILIAGIASVTGWIALRLTTEG